MMADGGGGPGNNSLKGALTYLSHVAPRKTTGFSYLPDR